MEFWWIQLVGFLAFAISSFSYQFKDQKTMFGYRVFSDALWAFHYFLLGASVPALTVMIAVLRSGLAVFAFPKHKLTIIILSIFAVWLICFYLGKSGWQSYLPLLGSIIYGTSTYYYDNYTISRILMALGFVVWVCIGFLFNSYAEIISSSIGFISILIGFYRHKRIKKLPQPHA
ncbi:MAG: hypothetical protein CMF61_04930 [Magnetococcales bacterium]|nr:hypothetical protein [Magnetococcales bacterium]|tara:strand:+ start:370 stop:894 length:525 start_codon:yes stop_codon:yes gene_type:complete